MNARINQLTRKCGAYAVAKHLRNRGYSIDQALTLMYGPAKLPALLRKQAF